VLFMGWVWVGSAGHDMCWALQGLGMGWTGHGVFWAWAGQGMAGLGIGWCGQELGMVCSWARHGPGAGMGLQWAGLRLTEWYIGYIDAFITDWYNAYRESIRSIGVVSTWP
jgi:hypothetical protein